MSDYVKYIKAALLVSGLMLCLALFPFWPESYYVVMKLVVCGTCGFTAFCFKQTPALKKFLGPLVFLSLLFNPVVPVYLDVSLWLLVDIGTAICLLTLAKKISIS